GVSSARTRGSWAARPVRSPGDGEPHSPSRDRRPRQDMWTM
ncbi:MAG: hypothetical protein AVDCRST_MAG19-1408, partial [uncultured Thermomicrobiales bacterium]